MSISGAILKWIECIHSKLDSDKNPLVSPLTQQTRRISVEKYTEYFLKTGCVRDFVLREHIKRKYSHRKPGHVFNIKLQLDTINSRNVKHGKCENMSGNCFFDVVWLIIDMPVGYPVYLSVAPSWKNSTS